MSPHSEIHSYGHDEPDHAAQVNGFTNVLTNGNHSTNGNAYTNGHDDAHAPHLHGLNGTADTNGTSKHTTTASPFHVQKPIHKNKSPYLVPSPDRTSAYDLICIGFGPASLSIAVALHDSVAAAATSSSSKAAAAPRVLFLEKQTSFAWHPGMLLPSTKMQISFIKDLATLRDPRSQFTFLNYLHSQDRLVDFTNLGTFLPARAEYEDYLRWCASWFEDCVEYGREVVGVTPHSQEKAAAAEDAVGVSDGGAVGAFTVESRNVQTGELERYTARNVVIAAGGKPALPKALPREHAGVIHSSQFAHLAPRLLPRVDGDYRVAVVGAGQSAAEIFNTVQNVYPNSRTSLVMRQEFLRPSDDSPFVNGVFNPEYIDTMFPRHPHDRDTLLTEARATNYGVVRLELIESLYEKMYEQRRHLGRDDSAWPHRILGSRDIVSVTPAKSGALTLKLRSVLQPGAVDSILGSTAAPGEEETLEVDLLVAATGYQRDAHVDMLRGTWDLLPSASEATTADGKVRYPRGVSGWEVQAEDGAERRMAVGRDYGIKYREGAVAKGSGVWLQGCCEGTHGLSDTLLSVLATRSGEIVNSMFGQGA